MQDFYLFDERKAAQAAACLLYKAKGRLHLLKLMKLMYLAERLSFQRYGDTITGDEFYSMQNGPVLSMTLNYLNGVAKSKANGWDSWIADCAAHKVALRNKNKIQRLEDDLVALSETDLECLIEVWKNFGHMSTDELVEYTHSDACPEWEDPGFSSRRIPIARLLKAVGYNPEQVETLTKRLHEQRYINKAFC